MNFRELLLRAKAGDEAALSQIIHFLKFLGMEYRMIR